MIDEENFVVGDSGGWFIDDVLRVEQDRGSVYKQLLRWLTRVETSLHDKGLPFIPSPQNMYSNPAIGESIDILRDKHKSKFVLPTRLRRPLDCYFEGIKYDIRNGKDTETSIKPY